MGDPVKFEGVNEDLQKILDADMDAVGPRRRAREAFKDIQLSIDHILFKMPQAGLKMKESYEVNSRGLEIFSKSWLPDSGSPKAVICFCHGYGDTCTFFFEGIARKLASSGYGVFAIDYPGFGLSEGLHGYIPNIDILVDNVIEHYSKVKGISNAQTQECCNPTDLRFLDPESVFVKSWKLYFDRNSCIIMPSPANGDEYILINRLQSTNRKLKSPHVTVFSVRTVSGGSNSSEGAPETTRCLEWCHSGCTDVQDDMVPPWLVTQILSGMAKLLPRLKLVPQKDMAELAFKDEKKRKQSVYNIIAYKHKPRLGTALELLRTTKEIEEQLEKVSLPLLILHGKEDKVTDPCVSKALYEKASSRDKKLNLYDDSYHSLLEGESDEMILRVFDDIISWLHHHCNC